jgi:SAM-dependent methyltransferase
MLGYFSSKDYRQRAFNTFCPRPIFKLDPNRNRQLEHWKSQDAGDPHGYDQYEDLGPKHTSALFDEIEKRMPKDAEILDLGCNCCYMLNALKKAGYSRLSGVDICDSAIEYGRKKFDLSGIDLSLGSYEKVLPKFVSEGRSFDLVYSGGASIALVHPSFDIVKYICAVSRKYVIMVDEDSLGLPYPRLWEYEFNRNAFAMVKYLKPSDGSDHKPGENGVHSIAVYQRDEGLMKKRGAANG